jgi:phenylacetic acid degradation operon negative regulatory protein
VSRPGPGALPARSVLLSVLLGSHPPRLPVRTLVRTAGLFGIAEGTARVALSRLTADGEVVADDGTYGLSAHHLERQRDQDSAVRPATRLWRGNWDLAVVLPDPDGRPTVTPADARRFFERRRMAELRSGVWTRPNNLRLPTAGLGPGDVQVAWWTGRPTPDTRSLRPVSDPGGAGQLARRLWDLDGWATGAVELIEQLAATAGPAERLALAAAMVRHLRADPMLPAALLPPRWPGNRLRKAYDGYRVELGLLIAEERDD